MGPVGRASRRIAILDGGSFVLPYVFGLAQALLQRGHAVAVYGSRTHYNGAFLEALRATSGVEVIDAAVSSSVAPRWRGALAYLALLWKLWRRRTEYATVNLQFSVLWPLELPLCWLLRDRLVFTVHNAVPHGFGGRRHRPTQWIARCARALIFPSHSTRDDFLRRYGAGWAAHATVLSHGLLPLAPEDAVTPYRTAFRPEALVYWSTVKPYKGVELLTELARSKGLGQRGLALEVHGRWDADLLPLKEDLIALGVHVDDRYLDEAALRTLFARNVVFVLPYREASQSGALYTLLNHGCYVLCSDVGDLGDFMRRHGLDSLLLAERSAAAVWQALDRLQAEGLALQQAFDQAQRRSRWACAMLAAGSVYDAAT